MQPNPDQLKSSAAPGEAAQAERADQVGALLAGLDTLDGRPLAEHVEVFEQVHGRLQTALRDIDNA